MNADRYVSLRQKAAQQTEAQDDTNMRSPYGHYLLLILVSLA